MWLIHYDLLPRNIPKTKIFPLTVSKQRLLNLYFIFSPHNLVITDDQKLNLIT